MKPGFISHPSCIRPCALVKQALTLLKAKRVIEEMLDKGRAVAQIPTVEDEATVARELGEAGCCASRLGRPEVDVRALRERLGLTQEQFALRYALDVDTLRNWESKRRHPDAAALAYLGVIASLPEAGEHGAGAAIGVGARTNG